MNFPCNTSSVNCISLTNDGRWRIPDLVQTLSERSLNPPTRRSCTSPPQASLRFLSLLRSLHSVLPLPSSFPEPIPFTARNDPAITVASRLRHLMATRLLPVPVSVAPVSSACFPRWPRPRSTRYDALHKSPRIARCSASRVSHGAQGKDCVRQYSATTTIALMLINTRSDLILAPATAGPKAVIRNATALV